MYLPIRYREKDKAALLELIRAYPLATVITQANGKPYVNHLPVIAETRAAGEVFLLGHMARANPQWQHFPNGETLVVFNGPHAYITPQWYKEPLNVPTWNYAVVHASGTARMIEDPAGVEEILQKSVTEFERHEPKAWQYELPEDFKKDLIQAIVGFEIPVTRLEGKFKLSQNRTEEDRQGVLDGLKTRRDEMSRKTLEMMRE